MTGVRYALGRVEEFREVTKVGNRAAKGEGSKRTCTTRTSQESDSPIQRFDAETDLCSRH
jgi:hypothetical protein